MSEKYRDKDDDQRHHRRKVKRERSRDRSEDRHRRHSSKKRRRSSESDDNYERRRRRRKRSRSGDEDSGEDSDDTRLDKKLAMEREKLKEEKRKQREAMKMVETPEEKRARRLAKKYVKEQKKKEDMGWGEECMGYSNADNPFGDKELTQQFIWEKKYEKAGVKKIDVKVVGKEVREKLEQNKQELEKIRRQREEREAMKADMEMMQRDRENKQFAEWSKQEDQFHLQQAKLRSRIRIREGRAKPIDLLACYIDADEEDNDDLDIEMHEPYTYLNGLKIRDYEDLLEDIRVYKKLSGGINDDYWNDLAIIAHDELDKLKKYDASMSEYVGDRREGIHSSVRSDVANLLKGKSPSELALLETEVLKKIKGEEEGVDVGYWESLLSQLKAHMARARLRQRHQETLKMKLLKLKQAQKAEPQEEAVVKVEKEEEERTVSAPDERQISEEPQMSEEPGTSEMDQVMTWDDLSAEDKREVTMESYENGGYSPQYVSDDVIPPGTEIIEAIEDKKRLEFSRTQCRATGRATCQKDAVMVDEARKGMTTDEASFAVEAPLEQKTYLWSEKYRPRKPRYFNRVHTGFEWNKYNQTHYDLDNPPPKIVQGYKFNIFYPDLLDVTKTPEFSVIPCKDEEDFAILKFHTGPPYEDIAFKIVNREWEVSHKKGYRCQFQNGIFQLWFHFKKYRYRR